MFKGEKVFLTHIYFNNREKEKYLLIRIYIKNFRNISLILSEKIKSFSFYNFTNQSLTASEKIMFLLQNITDCQTFWIIE